jgi:hypothetical protein
MGYGGGSYGGRVWGGGGTGSVSVLGSSRVVSFRGPGGSRVLSGGREVCPTNCTLSWPGRRTSMLTGRVGSRAVALFVGSLSVSSVQQHWGTMRGPCFGQLDVNPGAGGHCGLLYAYVGRYCCEEGVRGLSVVSAFFVPLLYFLCHPSE